MERSYTVHITSGETGCIYKWYIMEAPAPNGVKLMQTTASRPVYTRVLRVFMVPADIRMRR